MTYRPKNTRTGLNKEIAVRRWLERNGWEIVKEGTRGIADIVAVRGGSSWFIQVKYTRKASMNLNVFINETPALKRMATLHGGMPILCAVVQDRVWFLSARTGETLARGYL